MPWAPDVQVVYEHFHRYLWAAKLVEGRRVLDLGSGEGFGAAILAESATHVVGVDVDEMTVEHSRLSYAGPNLGFELGKAVDLSAFEDSSFGAVVAFEIIEHVREQEQVLAEVARVLADDGILVISTPNRRMYEQARSEPNRFHERELALEEFLGLLGANFPHVASWGQRTVTGSHFNPLGPTVAEGGDGGASEFFIERAGDEWRLAAGPAALYCVALASRAPLPAVAASSTLADCGIELVRTKERDTAAAMSEAAKIERAKEELRKELTAAKEEFSAALERERAAHARLVREREDEIRAERDQMGQRVRGADEDIVRSERLVASNQQRMLELQAHIDFLEASVGQTSRRVEESVTWQTFQKLRGRLYGAIGGERSLPARMLGASLRLLGRGLIKRPPPPAVVGESPQPNAPDIIQLREHDAPEVSLVIPVYAHAELTRACLYSIREHTTRIRCEVILVDDEADAETKQLLNLVSGARILRNEPNQGYLSSVNRGATSARGEWLVLCNNDIEVTSGWLDAMLTCAKSREKVGVVAPKFVSPDGRLSEAGGILWSDGTGVNFGRGDDPTCPRYEYTREIDYGSAAALMVRTELWREVAGYDERYAPMYYEDADLCLQARQRGWRVLYEPSSVVVHVEGATAGTDPQAGHKRHQEINRVKFVHKWKDLLEAEHLRPDQRRIRRAADRHRGPHVLVVDFRTPMWDRDAGSLRMSEIIRSLLRLGHRVTFVPDNFARHEPYTRELQRLGVEVIYGQVDPTSVLAEIGSSLTAAILSRPHPASRWLDSVREFAPGAVVIYDTVDLHWVRESRRYALSQPALSERNGAMVAQGPKAAALLELELAMMRASDVTVAVTEDERIQILSHVPDARVIIIPTIHDVVDHVAPPNGRRDVLFVGGFEHLPNVDAVTYLVREVMPQVWLRNADVSVTIVGGSTPAEIEELAAPRVDVRGWVADLQPLLDSARTMVVPVRYGAGVKGKITQGLAAGLPVVTTPVGAEGLDGRDGENMLIGGDAEALAERIVRVIEDDVLWQSLSSGGLELVAERCSLEILDERLPEVLAMGKS